MTEKPSEVCQIFAQEILASILMFSGTLYLHTSRILVSYCHLRSVVNHSYLPSSSVSCQLGGIISFI